MTTSLTEPDRLPWYRYIGPWPLRPLAMGVFITFLSFATTAAQLRIDSALRLTLSIIITGVGSGVFLWLAERYASGFVRSFGGYLVTVLVLSGLYTGIRLLSDSLIEFQRFGTWGNIGSTVVRSAIVAFALLAMLGITSQRLQRQVDRTQQALDIVQAQAGALLEADETVRQQVAAALHDRVQAGLVGACLQLQSLLPRVGAPDEGLLLKVIDSLEELRALDIRRAVRSLSPNLREVDLQSALDELADTYRPGMKVDVRVDIPKASYETQLGAYRIVEQSLLNSALHGQAHACTVTLHHDGHMASVEVNDDGIGIDNATSTGLGSTLISTWCRTLHGTWSRESSPGGGTTVRARLALSGVTPPVS